MSKTYTFKEPYFTIEVPVTTAVCAIAAVYCAWHAIAGDLLSPVLMLMFMAAAIYQVWNVVVSAAYPHHIVVDDESVSFCLYGRSDRYVVSEVKDMVIRGGSRNGRMFVRIDSPTIFRGRYWVNTEDFTDGDELRLYLLELECRVEPDGLRARAMRSAQAEREAEERRAALEEAGDVSVSRKGKKKRGGKKRAASLGTKADMRLESLPATSATNHAPATTPTEATTGADETAADTKEQ